MGTIRLHPMGFDPGNNKNKRKDGLKKPTAVVQTRQILENTKGEKRSKKLTAVVHDNFINK